MAEARAEQQWDHTASLLALIAETNRDPTKRFRPFTPLDFHPMHRRPKGPTELTEAEMTRQLEAFAGKRFADEKPGLFETIFGRK